MTGPTQRTATVMLLLLALAVTVGLAQRRGGGRFSPRNAQADTPLPEWTNDPEFEQDVYTFARIEYASSYGRGYGYGGGGRGRWHTDAPDADINFGFRLQQLTSLKVYPKEKHFPLTSPELFDFPFIYIVEPGALEFSPEEATALRKYLLNGGFLMVDDFWGDAEWENFYEQIKLVFPTREPEELEMSHPIFHCVFDLKMEKNQMQVPNMDQGTQSQYTGVTWEPYHFGNTRDVHFRAIFDDKRRMMVFICHNTDNGDGWEREGYNEYFFREFSEKKAYPLGINIVFYAMTH